MTSPVAATRTVHVLRPASRASLATALLPAALVAAALVGCGESALRSSGTDEPLPVAVVVVADEYRYRPATLSAVAPLRVRLDNAGALAHTWTVLAAPIATEVDLGSATVIAEAMTEAGQTSTVDLTALAPGTYQVVCAIPGHISAGMVGQLVLAP